MNLFLFMTIICSSLCLAQSFDPNAFVIKILDGKVIINAPKNENKLQSVRVENLTFNKIISQFTFEDKVLKRCNLEAHGTSKSLCHATFDFSKRSKIEFTSLSPPMQTIVLKIGMQDYEIP